MESKKYALNREYGLKILKGAGIALGGALATYLLTVIPDVDFGTYTPLVVALSSVLLNAAIKFLSGQPQ